MADGTVYVGSDDGNLYAVDAATGTEEWAFETENSVNSSPTVVNGTVYVGSNDHNLYAVDTATGTEKWAFETGGLVMSSPTVADGTVYVGGYDYNLYAVDVTTGTEKWAFETGSLVESSPTVVNGTVYVGSNDHNLYAVDTATGTEKWAFETGGLVMSSPTVADGTVYIGGYDYNLYAITASAGSETRGNQPSKRCSEMKRSSITKDSSKEYPEIIKTSTAQIPSPEAVRSPKRRNLSPEDFQTIENLGGGGQAVIKKVRLPDSKALPGGVALRGPATQETITPEAVEEFLEHAETWAMIDARERDKQRWERSEHIVGVIDTGDHLPWIAMEYMNGGDLTELLEEHPDGLPVAQAVWVGECVCKGLEIAHNLGRVHLDVKPGNVLLKQTDGWPWPKLADWGLARTLARETGTMEGLSVEYASPEQFDSSTFGDPDHLTDIYQTGALVYTLLTGRPPVTGSRTEIVATALTEESIPVPSERRPELPAVVDATVGLALERQKTERYRSNIIGYDIRHGQSSYTPIWLAALTGGGVAFYMISAFGHFELEFVGCVRSYPITCVESYFTASPITSTPTLVLFSILFLPVVGLAQTKLTDVDPETPEDKSTASQVESHVTSSSSKIYGYVRQSQTDEDKSSSIESQRQGARYAAEEEGHSSVEFFEDKDESGFSFDRDGIQKLLNALERESRPVVLDRIDRLGRDTLETIYVTGRIHYNYEVDIITEKHGVYELEKIDEQLDLVLNAIIAGKSVKNRIRAAWNSIRLRFSDDRRWSTWFNKIPIGYQSDGKAVLNH